MTECLDRKFRIFVAPITVPMKWDWRFREVKTNVLYLICFFLLLCLFVCLFVCLLACFSCIQRNTYNLILQEAGYFEGYNDSVNPSAINSFATAAFRLGHSMVRNEYSRHGPTPYNRPFDPVPLKSHYDNPVPFYDVCQGGVDALFRGLFADPGQTVDR